MPAKKKQDQLAPDDKQTVADLMPTTPDLRAERLAELRRLFPDLFDGEGQLNEKELRQLANPGGAHLKERYEFTWTGKQASKEEAFKPSKAALVYDEKRSVNPDKADGNLIIEGENLEVLKQLTSAYRGQVKLIYIDPPYNTGKDFVYSDRFAEDKKPYWEEAGVTERGVKVDTNTDTDGRYHSNWLTMMHSRLLAARYLLREDGVIFVSIDDNEVANLKRLMDVIFGEEYFLSQLVWKNKYNAGALTKGFSSVHEYTLCYSRSEILNLTQALSEEDILRYSGRDEKYETRGGFVTQPLATSSKDPRPNLVYPITIDDQVINPDKQWIWEKSKVEKAIANNEIVVNDNDGKPSVRHKQYLRDENGKLREKKPLSVLVGPYNQEGTKESTELLGKDVFTFPKPSRLIRHLLSLTINESSSKDAIILDFFAGSGTTGQAVMDLNATDGGNRKHILVQLPELTAKDSTADKAGYKKISDITIDRNKRVIDRYRDEAKLAEKSAKAAEQALAKAEKQKKGEKLPGMSDDKQLDNLRETAEQARKEADQKKAFADRLGFKVYTLEKSAFPRVDFVPDPDATEDENVAKLKQYIAEKEASFNMTWDRERIVDEVLLKNGLMLDYTLEDVKDFKDNQVQRATDGSGRSYLFCLDATLAPATVDAFKKAPHNEQVFICLEKALDSTTKWNLKHHLGDRLRAM